ncbi:MAG TPA: hypothetical protein VLF91_04535 [Candidatus Saccharimonadales bacterium]|nr:hypothetical protein [Candidatus Saccharimonadales bacterium]
MESVYQQIYGVHARHLNFNGVEPKPVLVVFSAIPGSGKSELTKRLVASYGFFRLANKDIRHALETTGHADDVAIGEYTLWFLNEVTRDKSLSIVFDRNIDQWYEPSKSWASANGYRYVLIRIDVDRKALQQRLLKREGDGASHVLDVMDFYAQQHDAVTNRIKPDLLLEGDYDLDEAAQRIAAY